MHLAFGENRSVQFVSPICKNTFKNRPKWRKNIGKFCTKSINEFDIKSIFQDFQEIL